MSSTADPGCRRWRIAGLVAGSLAVVLLVVVGCTRVAGGTAEVDSVEVAQYRTEVSESASSSRSAESSRQASATRAARLGTCEEVRFSNDTVDAVNRYVEAVNAGANADDAAGSAIGALNGIADRVEATLSSANLEADFVATATAWIDATRALVGAVERRADEAEYNDISDRFNATLSDLRAQCSDR